jgi:hypothetical protein
MQQVEGLGAFHNAGDIGLINTLGTSQDRNGTIIGLPYAEQFSYEFENFFHPFVGSLIQQLNQTSVAGMLDPSFLETLQYAYTSADYTVLSSLTSAVTLEDQTIDVSVGGPYANYNWELLYHIPVMIAVHLSGNQRFAEAQNWFHLVFDPTSTDTTVPPPGRFWKSFVFRNGSAIENIDALVSLLSTPDAELDAAQIQAKTDVITGYNGILASPFDPHLVARTRPSAYQWYVVMKYLDNLIAWGDSLFLADTIETLNEATLCYVLAANILGPRPQVMPQPTAASAKNFLQLKQAGLDRMSDALVSLEAQFPFNLVSAPAAGGGAPDDQSGALFGIGRSLYFCVPQNQNLLTCWDTVADRLFKIRNSENIQGVVQQLPLFDPPLDPGMLVQAAAAGIDIGSIVSGLNQPLGPVRSLLLIGKALEIAAEVRALGSELLAALEKGDAEQLALLRQGHEIQLQQLTQNVRYLAWQHAQETTNGLLKTRAATLERYAYYLRLLNLAPDASTVPPDLSPDRRELTEANFADTYSALVGEYDLAIATLAYNPLQPAQGSSPSTQSGATGQGQLYLNTNEDSELNTHLPQARDGRIVAVGLNAAAAAVTPIPSALEGVRREDRGRHAQDRRRHRRDLRGLAPGAGGHSIAHRRISAAGRRMDPPGEPGRTRACADRVPDHRLADRRADRLPRLPDGQGPGAAGTGGPGIPAEQVHQRGLLHLDAKRSVRPVLPVLPVRVRHRPAGRADHETRAHAAGARRDPVHPVQLLGFRPSGPALRRGAASRYQADGDGLPRQ